MLVGLCLKSATDLGEGRCEREATAKVSELKIEWIRRGELTSNGVVASVFGAGTTVAITVEAGHGGLGEEGEGFFEDCEEGVSVVPVNLVHSSGSFNFRTSRSV